MSTTKRGKDMNTKRGLGIAATIATVLLSIGQAFAVTQAINACLDNNGAIRVLQVNQYGFPPNPCQSYETPISWNNTGPQGAPGVSGWELVRGAGIDVPPTQIRGNVVNCPTGKKPVGGGFVVNGPGPWTVFESDVRSNPGFNENGYAAFIRNDGAALVRIFVDAVCVIAQ
jgi:hypothetical protein